MHQRDRLTPYFDLFGRLDDKQLARLAQVEPAVVMEVRPIVESIVQPLGEYDRVLEAMSDAQISRAFGLPEAAVKIWRLCRAPETLTAEQRTAPGVLDDIMGPADSDIMIAIEDDDPAFSPSEASSSEDLDWGDL